MRDRTDPVPGSPMANARCPLICLSRNILAAGSICDRSALALSHLRGRIQSSAAIARQGGCKAARNRVTRSGFSASGRQVSVSSVGRTATLRSG